MCIYLSVRAVRAAIDNFSVAAERDIQSIEQINLKSEIDKNEKRIKNTLTKKEARDKNGKQTTEKS